MPPGYWRALRYWAWLPFRPAALREMHRHHQAVRTIAALPPTEERATLIFLGEDGATQSTRTQLNGTVQDRILRGHRLYAFSHRDHDGALVYRQVAYTP